VVFESHQMNIIRWEKLERKCSVRIVTLITLCFFPIISLYWEEVLGNLVQLSYKKFTPVIVILKILENIERLNKNLPGKFSNNRESYLQMWFLFTIDLKICFIINLNKIEPRHDKTNVMCLIRIHALHLQTL
jgi:hypothetical protein